VNENNHKSEGKRAKCDAKARKAEAKAAGKAADSREEAALRRTEILAGAEPPGARGLPGGVGIAVERRDGRSELVVSGLKDEQLRRIVPGLTKEVLIAVTEETSVFRAGMMRFVRDGVVPAIVKIVAGLIVGYLLFRFGLR
jgi:hypothetical protein